jgi:trehalose 6-phosphate phosphatase
VYVGNHGLELWTDHGPEIAPEARPWVPRLKAVLERVEANLLTGGSTSGGIVVENKGVTASLHYRNAERPEEARRLLLELLAREALTSGLRIEEGRMVLNLLPPVTVTKGSAVSWLIREHRLNGMVYLGDDLTDAHAFRALKAMRETSDVKALSIGVVGPETPLRVRQLADATVPSCEAVAELLCSVASRLGLPGASGRMDDGAPTVRRHIHGQ